MNIKFYRLMSIFAFVYFVITMFGRFGTYSDGIDAAFIFVFIWVLGYESKIKD